MAEITLYQKCNVCHGDGVRTTSHSTPCDACNEEGIVAWGTFEIELSGADILSACADIQSSCNDIKEVVDEIKTIVEAL
jgi:DnaJ-class molecular chaperone